MKTYNSLSKIEEFKYSRIEELIGDKFTNIEEIPESEWDKKTISMWEDNNFDKKPFKVYINDIICGKEPQMIFTNDFSSF